MITISYLVFTFLACVLCAGLGLALHIVTGRNDRRTRELALERGTRDASDLAEFTLAGWDAVSRVEAANNRRFAFEVLLPAALPVVFAGIAWTARADVVQSVCHGIAQVAEKSPLCF